MFIGHFAPAFAASAASPRAPGLGTLFVAAQLVDWAFFTFAILGIEHMRIVPGITEMVPFDLYDMPLTHSLLATGIWAAGFAVLVRYWTKDSGAGFIAGLVVASHWALDLLVHRPDLTLLAGPEAYGLGLWNYPWIEIPLEIGITAGAFYWYLKKTIGPAGPPFLLLFMMVLFQIVNWFGPVPEQADMSLYITALFAFAILTLMAYWVGTTRRHIRARG